MINVIPGTPLRPQLVPGPVSSQVHLLHYSPNWWTKTCVQEGCYVSIPQPYDLNFMVKWHYISMCSFTDIISFLIDQKPPCTHFRCTTISFSSTATCGTSFVSTFYTICRCIYVSGCQSAKYLRTAVPGYGWQWPKMLKGNLYAAH